MNSNLREYIEKNSKKNDANLKYDFMPEMLEVIERPAHKAGSVIIWTIFGLLLFVILWATFSKVEVVATAQGRIVPAEDETIITAKTRYEIEEICVEPGQRVNEGDVLVKLSAKDSEENKEDLEEQLADKQSVVDVYKKIINKEDISTIDVSTYKASIQAEIEEILSEYESTMELVKQYRDSNFKTQANELEKDYYNKASQSVRDMELEIEDLNEQLKEVNEEIEAATVKAPFNGTVYEVYIEKKDVIVSSNAPIVSIIKEDAVFEMECYVSDRDVADLEVDQNVNIKLDAYPYGDYGTIDGKITFISERATVMEGVGNVVVVKIAITDEKFNSKVFPGLSGTADMIIGERRIIEYFLGTITDAMKESIREK